MAEFEHPPKFERAEFGHPPKFEREKRGRKEKKRVEHPINEIHRGQKKLLNPIGVK